MKLLIISHALHKSNDNKYYAYGPYVREMNLWTKHFKHIMIVSPLLETNTIDKNELRYDANNIQFFKIPALNLLNIRSAFKAVFSSVLIFVKCISAMRIADHIHLRCPGNIGLIGCVAQMFFPYKIKTAKYAGNWDWNSKQPWSYRLQQRILRNTFLTHNMTVLVYGEWPDKTKNIKPFFTASYSEADKEEVVKSDIQKEVRLAFVGSLSPNKSPLSSLEVLKLLTEKGIPARLTFCGEGPERDKIEHCVEKWNLNDKVELLGNIKSEHVKEILQQSHFLVFISRSEGWPKAVAEAMWWGCVPITTVVSCVPQMLGNGERGFLVENNSEKIAEIIRDVYKNTDKFLMKSFAGMEWSREYTLEIFEENIKKLL